MRDGIDLWGGDGWIGSISRLLVAVYSYRILSALVR